MKKFQAALRALVSDREKPSDAALGGVKKNYTEALSHQISRILAAELRELGLERIQAPTSGRDKSFMGGLRH